MATAFLSWLLPAAFGMRRLYRGLSLRHAMRGGWLAGWRDAAFGRRPSANLAPRRLRRRAAT